MRQLACNSIPLCFFIILLIVPLRALALPTINCHCFTDRSYDTARPAAADPYFLAMTQNSFFTVVFNVDKKTIVFKKQQGTSPDDLWIAYWIASKLGVSPDFLLQSKSNSEWKDVAAQLKFSTKALGSQFSRLLSTKAPSAALAETVVDSLFVRYKFMSDVDLAALRQAGASNQELIIAAVIAAKTRQPAKQAYLDVKKDGKTWGYLLREAKVDTKNMQHEISRILKLDSQFLPSGS